MSDERVDGTVKWFDDRKGFGFIETGSGQDLFVHHTEIQMEGFKKLEDGQAVTCIIADDAKGPKAVDVQPA